MNSVRSYAGYFSQRKDIAAQGYRSARDRVQFWGAPQRARDSQSGVSVCGLAGEAAFCQPQSPCAGRHLLRFFGGRTSDAAGCRCLDHARAGRQQPCDRSACGALQLRTCASRIWNVAGSLQFPFFYGASHHRVGQTVGSCKRRCSSFWRAALDMDWIANAICSTNLNCDFSCWDLRVHILSFIILRKRIALCNRCALLCLGLWFVY
jgi:hypothetical protein